MASVQSAPIAAGHNVGAAWAGHDIDDPNNIDLILAAMNQYMARNAVNGRLQFEDDGFDYNVTVPMPALEEPEPQNNVVVRFQSVEHFKNVHKAASEFEDNLESRDYDSFNNEHNSFKAWPLLGVPEDDDVTTWLFLIEPTQAVEARIPNVGETCQLRLFNTEVEDGISTWWTARRAHNNFASAGGNKADWSKLIAFNVRVAVSENETDCTIHGLIPTDGNQHENLAKLELTTENSVNIGLFFTKSDATFEAEMKSLSKLVKAARVPPVTPLAVINHEGAAENVAKVGDWLEIPREDLPVPGPTVIPKPINPRAVQPRQVSAFRYLLDFKEPEEDEFVNMFEVYPHMLEPGPGIPGAIFRKYVRMDDHQRRAYDCLLSKMPHGIAMLPGGPGGGKTDWVMTVIGLMQSKSSAKVLYLLDINGPLDDATAKYIWLMKNAGLNKKAIRMRNFGAELKNSVRVGSMGNRATNEPAVDFTKSFMALYTQHTSGNAPAQMRSRHQHIIPTLDEAAWEHYDNNRFEFEELTDAIQTCNGSAVTNRQLRKEIYDLYSTVLRQADFIATTPCVAGSVFYRMFKPDLVVFDEAAHARELSTLIAIANFCPKAGWIFIGDHRQTQPTVKSNNTNPHGRQLATSAMERAYLAGVLEHQLLINHRAYGRLERLPSKLVYDYKMVNGVPHEKRFPRFAKFVRGFLQDIAGVRCSTPRLIVHLHGVDRPVRVGTSWYHPQHMAWTMSKVLELVKNPRFRSAENEANSGTILLLAPYKAAVTKYQDAIDELAKANPRLRIPQRVEARTWDSAQGHEADIVAIDYVRDHPTPFMDGMYRFNVGLTRARQGEWHLMHPNMPKADSFHTTNYLRKLYSACEVGLDGIGEGRIANIAYSAEPPSVVPNGPAAVVVSEDTAEQVAGPELAGASDTGAEAEMEADDLASKDAGSVIVLSEIGQDDEAEDDLDDDPDSPSPSTVYSNSSAANTEGSLVQDRMSGKDIVLEDSADEDNGQPGPANWW